MHSRKNAQVIIKEFKELNKAKHQEIKETAKALKEEIRDQVETEATRHLIFKALVFLN